MAKARFQACDNKVPKGFRKKHIRGNLCMRIPKHKKGK